MDRAVARISSILASPRAADAKGSNAAYSIMRRVGKEARQDPKRIAFRTPPIRGLLRAIQQIVDEGIAKPCDRRE